MTRVKLWRELGRPEAALVGVQYAASDYGARLGAYTVRAAATAPWAFVGTGLGNGDMFGGGYGIEIDARSAASPPGTLLLASIPDLMGPGRSAEMTYYETPRGAKVFAARRTQLHRVDRRPDRVAARRERLDAPQPALVS